MTQTCLRYITTILTLLGLILLTGCTLASPFNQLLDQATEPTAEIAAQTPRPTFTATSPASPTPTQTATPTITPIPTDTPTLPPPTATPTLPPTATPTDAPTNTPAPPPPPTNTPGPTDTPAPSWDYLLAELFHAPTNSTLLSIIVAVQGHDGGWIPGLRVVGIDPNGNVTKSDPTLGGVAGHTPDQSSVVKSGNVKFEPQPVSVYITGIWRFHLETVDGTQVSDTFTVDMNEEEGHREWYFFRFQPAN